MYVNMDALILLTIAFNINNVRFLTHLKIKKHENISHGNSLYNVTWWKDRKSIKKLYTNF